MIRSLLTLFLLVAPSWAHAAIVGSNANGCYVQAPNSGSTSFPFFDNTNNANTDPGACMGRADDWIHWFQTYGYAGPYIISYYVNGVPTVSTWGTKTMPTCPSGWVCPPTPAYSSKIGMWYEPWFQNSNPATPTLGSMWQTDSNHYMLRQPVGVPTGVGPYYDSSNDQLIQYHFGLLNQMQVNFLIMDWSNGVTGQVETPTLELLRWEATQPAANQIPVAVAIGDALWATGPNYQTVAERSQAQLAELENITTYIYDNTTYRNLMFTWPAASGQPLIVETGSGAANPFYPAGFNANNTNVPNYTPSGGYGGPPANYTLRVAAEEAYPFQELDPTSVTGDNTGYWGWTFEFPQYARNGSQSFEAVGVSPGVNNAGNGGTYYISRAKGLYYMTDWVKAIKANPSIIVVSAFNQGGDGNDIEPSTPRTDVPANNEVKWTDAYGNEETDLYVFLTTAYANLRTGLMNGITYRDENSSFMYQVAGGRLFNVSVPPTGQPVVVLPANTIQTFLGGANPFVTPPTDGTVIQSSGLPSGIMSGGELVRFGTSSLPPLFGSTTLTLSASDYNILSYGGTIATGSAMYQDNLQQYPPVFVSDRGDAFPTSCSTAIGYNGSPSPTLLTTLRYGQFNMRNALTCPGH